MIFPYCPSSLLLTALTVLDSSSSWKYGYSISANEIPRLKRDHVSRKEKTIGLHWYTNLAGHSYTGSALIIIHFNLSLIMATSSSQKKPYIPYHNPFSICSLMGRYTLAIRGEPKDAASEVVVDEHEVDIFREAQLEEKFLCEVNPKGQVSLT